MYKEALRPAWVEVNLTNLEYNIKNIQAKAGDRPLIGVIKADAYGHGAEEVARVLVDNGVKTWLSQLSTKPSLCVKLVLWNRKSSCWV